MITHRFSFIYPPLSSGIVKRNTILNILYQICKHNKLIMQIWHWHALKMSTITCFLYWTVTLQGTERLAALLDKDNDKLEWKKHQVKRLELDLRNSCDDSSWRSYFPPLFQFAKSNKLPDSLVRFENIADLHTGLSFLWLRIIWTE